MPVRGLLSGGQGDFRGCFPIGPGLPQLSLLRYCLLRQVDVPSREILGF
ncbi:hypothetical protein CEV32_4049 [Brucella rhizosphaerae]|uniref:Uncharacterized protein n=1 Tax=Brucella rhizosphaerae TaxID=571254 RepID=A0A256FR12_9HYPH|nr:hypothetical protein CEV32_4049 [Brucella rhizosphaerae]